MFYGNFLGMPSSFWICTLIIWIICGVLCVIIAYGKGNEESSSLVIAFVLGVLFGIFALIFYAASTDYNQEKRIKDLEDKISKLELERAIKKYGKEDKKINDKPEVADKQKEEPKEKVEEKEEKVIEKKTIIVSPNDEDKIICPYCGFEQSKDRKVCWKCGEELK